MANISNILDPEVRAWALARIGFYTYTTKQDRQVDYCRLLSWFIGFASRDLAKMSPSEQFSVREEIRALQEEGLDFVVNDATVAGHWKKTQETVAHHLQALTQQGRVALEPFQLTLSVTIPRFLPQGATGFAKPLYVGEMVEPFDGQGLLYLFAMALRHAGDRLRHCPHCSILFVQVRRKQRFCTRKCQQVASMRDLRGRQRKDEKRKRNTALKKRSQSYGTKRR